jgi:hypothetical protein
MAVMAVCSFVLTSCYEKPVSQKTPSEYYVMGTVYDAETGQVISNATVTVAGKSVSSTFNFKLDTYVPAVTVVASAEGYVTASRTFGIEKLADYNQVSYTNADLALVKINTPVQPEPDTVLVVVGVPVAGVTGMDAAAVSSHFGINNGEVSMGANGLVEVFTHYGFVDSQLNVEANVSADQVLYPTNMPYTVKDVTYSGYIWDYTGSEYVDELKSACNYAFGTVNVGNTYADFAANSTPFSKVLNEDGSLSLVGYCVCKDFTLWGVPVSIDGVKMNILALQANSTHVTPIVGDNHDNHDNHNNGDNHHNNHDNHSGATAYGGGTGAAE